MKHSKKILSAVTLLLLTILLVACQPASYKVEFESNGGSNVALQTVKKGGFATRPDVPTKDDYIFIDWFAKEDLSGEAFKFSTTAITANTKLYASWQEESADLFVRFTDHQQDKSTLVQANEQGLATFAEPTRSGFKFGGWFSSKRGLTWNDKAAVAVPVQAAAGPVRELFAYWEPLNSVDINWSDAETYRSTITKQARMILNPLTYENSLEDDLVNNMATPLFSTEVDWGKAISQGVASFPGDFSKIEAGEFSVESLDYHNIMVGAARFPLNADGDDLLDENGKYDRTAATSRTSSEWTFTLRDDIKFQDGTPVNASTYEYTLKQYLDKTQNNYRANTMYRTKANKNGVPILNAFEYFSQSVLKKDANGNPVLDTAGNEVYEAATVAWDSVGFEIIDEFTFKMTFHEPYTQAAAVSFGALRLVHPAKYEASLNRTTGNSNYGTPNSPYMSYGPYVLKSWDLDQKLVFNKNYDYVAKDTINYKSTVYELVENTEQTLNLYRDGKIDVIGLNANNFEEFAESTNIFRSFTGYPYFLSINTAPSKAEGANRHVPDSILFDTRFRQALMFGFDRVDYNENYDIPNVPSFVPVPGDIKNYVQDTKFFTDSPEYLKVLEEFDVDPATHGYLPTRALELFNASYADWLAEGNSGPVTLKMIAPDSTITKLTSARVKAMYESFFTKDGVKRLVIDLHNLDSTQRSQVSANWDFDMTLGGIGFGGSLGSYWQMGAIAFAGGMLGGASLGLSQPYSTDLETGEQVLADYADEIIEIDFTTTYNRIVALGGFDYLEEAELDNTAVFFEWLQEELDESGNIVKPAGILRQSVLDVVLWTMSGDEPFDATAEEPFPGAGNDANKLAAAMLEVFYRHVTHIPTGTSASATLYADKVVVDWPAYSTAFGWGAARYRHLNTDKDFQ